MDKTYFNVVVRRYFYRYFYCIYIVLFMALVIRLTALRGGRKQDWGGDMQQRATGQTQALGRCSKDKATGAPTASSN